MSGVSAGFPNAASDAPKGKGGTAEAARPIQVKAMLNVAERPGEGKMLAASPPKFHTVSGLRKAQLWLDAQVAEAGANVAARLVAVTPDLAEVLLSRNEGNRRIKQRRVDDFARDMLAGDWKLNGEPLIISTRGQLNDGQHRCAAIQQCGATVDMLVVFGVDGETRDTVDHGVTRSPGDDLALHGHNNTILLAATARSVWKWRAYGSVQRGGNRAPTRAELIHTVEGNPGIERSLSGIVAKGRKARALGEPATLAFCHFAFRTVAADTEVAYFFDALVEGENLKRGDPILNARNRLIAERTILSTEQRAELLFRAWNAHRNGETSRVAFRLTGGELPMLE